MCLSSELLYTTFCFKIWYIGTLSHINVLNHVYPYWLFSEISWGQLSVSSKKDWNICMYVAGGFAKPPKRSCREALCHIHSHICTFGSFFLQIWGCFTRGALQSPWKAHVEKGFPKPIYIRGFAMGASWSPCKASIERGFVKPLYIRGFTMGALLSLQSSYREGLTPHTYTHAHFSLFSCRYRVLH